MESWDGWDVFLKVIASDHDLTVGQTAVFFVRLSRQSIDEKRTNQQIADEVIGGEPHTALSAYNKRMENVFDKLSQSFPEINSKKINSKSGGKVERTQACLEKAYLEQQKKKKSEATSHAIAPTDWQKVCCDRLKAREQQRLTTNPLTGGDGMKYELDEIHVPLGLVERKQRPKIGNEVLPQRGLQPSEYEIGKKFEYGEFLDQVLSKQRQSHADKKTRLAIIGEAGAGKTTLLQKIAAWVFEAQTQVAIWVSLADLQGKTLEEYLLQIWLKEALEVVGVTPEQENALVELFKSDRVWLLLDGVDEMTIGKLPLQAIASHLTGWIARARVVLTCRLNVWEANVNDLENFEKYRILEFSYSPVDQVEEFINKWFNKIDLERGQRLRTELNQIGKERIRDLVRNPLRLALLCRTWQLYEGSLPDTKAQLYQQFVDTFYLWKSQNKEFRIDSVQREELKAKLGELARDAIDRKSSRFRLSESDIRRLLGNSDEEGSLFGLATKINLLIPVGVMAENPIESVYTFFHPTFQEYFAACAISDWDFFLNDVSIDPRSGTFRIFEPQWKTVILLWLGRKDMESQHKEKFIEALVLFNDMREGFYRYRAQFLAAAGIAEFRDYSWADKLLSLIVKWSCGALSIDKQEWRAFLEPIQEGARAALLETDSTKAVAALVKFIQNAQNEYDCTCGQAAFSLMQAALSLGQIDRDNPVAIAVLLELIEKSQDEEIRLQAALNLGQIDEGNPIVVNALRELIQNYDEQDIQGLAIENLGKMGLGAQKAIPALVELIENSQDEITRLYTADNLGQIEEGNPIAIATLVELIKNPQSHYVCEQAAESLVKIGVGNWRAVAALIELIENSKYEIPRLQAAWSLGNLEEGNPIAIATLIELIEKSKYKNICDLAAKSLEEIGAGNRKAIAALVELIEKSQDESTRWLAAASLGQIEEGNPIAITTLVELIKNYQDEALRLAVAQSLGEIGKGNSNAVAALVELIEKSQDENTRLQVAESLGKIEEGNPIAVAILVELIKNTQDTSVLWRTAKSLSKIDKGNPIAVATLVELIKNTQDTSRYGIEVWSLGKIDKGIATAALVKYLQIDQSVELFYAITNSLGDILGEAQMAVVVVKALKDYLSKETYKNDFRRFEACHKVIGYCAQNMSYPDFYYAWLG